MSGVITQYSLGDLVTQIKQEAKLSGSTDLDNMVIATVNELLLEYCYNNRYFELLKLNYQISTVGQTQTYPLPPDFQHFKAGRYQNSNGSSRTLYPLTEYTVNPISSIPRFYQIAGSSINILPSDNIQLNEIISLDYYSFPIKLTDLTNDFFPIPRLFGPLKQKAIYRALTYNKVETAAAFKTDAQENEARSKPSN